ncbi:MAG: NAD(P)/FAD-dependent oxidoreductase, partial [Verrucomicrobiota bacterium]
MGNFSEKDEQPVIIIGAGMAGLSAAVHLHRSGIPVLVLEASDGVGGRVRTDLVNGFRLDRGFQVYLDAYPETGALLDLEKLDLRSFEPGALVYKNGKLHRLMDVFRRPGSAFESIRAPVGSLPDKLRTGWLRTRILNSSLHEIDQRPDRSTEVYLKESGFSDSMIDTFFRSFYGGIFLERELQTSSRMFEFTFKMFGKGSATLPAKGMGEIPKQLLAQLPKDCLRLNTTVIRVKRNRAILSSGEEISGSALVIATDATVARRLLPEVEWPEPKWRSVTNLYYAADQSPANEPIICLNGS